MAWAANYQGFKSTYSIGFAIVAELTTNDFGRLLRTPGGPKDVQFAESNGLSKTLFLGAYSEQNRRIRDPYRFVGESAELGALKALVAPATGNFGNQMQRLGNMLALAERHSIPRIYIGDVPELPTFFRVLGVEVRTTFPSLDAVEPALIGNFFRPLTLGPLLDQCRSNSAIFSNFPLDLFPFSPGNEEDGTLTIHVRSGDIFRDPHPNYGQPPFAFYKRLILDGTGRYAIVRLIVQDHKNPVIRPLIRFVRKSGLRIELIYGLTEAMQCLLGASDVVLSKGTFALPLVAASRNTRKVTFFEFFAGNRWPVSEIAPQTKAYFDKSGVYRESVLKNWKNSKNQRHLMKTYPLKYIVSGEQVA